jgi:hypothetical protein
MPLQVQQQMQVRSTGSRQALLAALLSQNARTSLLRMTRFWLLKEDRQREDKCN